MKHKKPIIGLCGGIGAGKSAVAAEFERQGCVVIESDRLNHEVLGLPAVQEQLQAWWGPEVVKNDGTVDRQRISRIVFDSPHEKGRLERLVYPLIAQRRVTKIRAVEQEPAVKAIVLDSPLLLESNLDRDCDTVIFIEASESQRLRRLRDTRGWSTNELKRRERWQTPLTEKRSRAEFVIDNNGELDQLRPQVADILNVIVNRYSTSA